MLSNLRLVVQRSSQKSFMLNSVVFKTTGTVKWFDTKKGFGFVTVPGGKDYFVHQQSILKEGFRSLKGT